MAIWHLLLSGLTCSCFYHLGLSIVATGNMKMHPILCGLKWSELIMCSCNEGYHGEYTIVSGFVAQPVKHLAAHDL